MKKIPLHRVAPLVGLTLFGVALWVLHGELRHHSYHQVFEQSLPADRVALSLVLTVVSYLLLTGYDALGLRYARHRLPYRRTALASFVGYAFSNTIGYSLVSGGSVRLRLQGHRRDDLARGEDRPALTKLSHQLRLPREAPMCHRGLWCPGACV